MKGAPSAARDHVGGGRHLADVELEVAHHAAERADDRHHLDEVRLDAGDLHPSVLQGGGVAVGRERNFQPWGGCHSSSFVA